MCSGFLVRDPEFSFGVYPETKRLRFSDYQWCRQRDINPGTFYNWVSKLRKSGYSFPDSQSKSAGTPVVQEVVKLDVVDQGVSSPVIERNACPLPLSRNTDVAAELIVGNVTLRLFNGADQQLIQRFICKKNGYKFVYQF